MQTAGDSKITPQSQQVQEISDIDLSKETAISITIEYPGRVSHDELEAEVSSKLQVMATSSDPAEVEEAAASLLEEIGNNTQNKNTPAIVAAVRLLADTSNKEYQKLIYETGFSHPYHEVSMAAAESLQGCAVPEILKSLTTRLIGSHRKPGDNDELNLFRQLVAINNNSPHHMEEAAIALTGTQDKTTLKALREALPEKPELILGDSFVGDHITTVLQSTNDPDTNEYLSRLILKGETRYQRRLASEALPESAKSSVKAKEADFLRRIWDYQN